MIITRKRYKSTVKVTLIRVRSCTKRSIRAIHNHKYIYRVMKQSLVFDMKKQIQEFRVDK